MAFTNITAISNDSNFRAKSATGDAAGWVSVSCDSADGFGHAYRRPDMVIEKFVLITPTPTKLSEMAAAASASSSAARQDAYLATRCQILCDKAQAGALTSAEIQESLVSLFRMTAPR